MSGSALRIIGLMSGTSVDGIDAALVEIEGAGRQTRIRLLGFKCVPHTPKMRAAILTACDPRRGRVPDLCTLNAALGDRFAEAAIAVAKSAGVPLSSVDAIASHGQTIHHQPSLSAIAGTASRGTLQIGEPAIIAARTNCRVISSFRAADMAAGGQGAPLVAYADWALLTSSAESRASLNIGGVANVTHLPCDAQLDQVTAFDTGPGNMVIDELVRVFTKGERDHDENGKWASTGTVNGGLLARLLNHPFFGNSPPKSTGREAFGQGYAARVISMARRRGLPPPDVLATATALTAETVAESFRRWIEPRGGAQTVIVGGGGVHNQTLMSMLRERLAPARLATHEEFGIPGDAKEAIAFALLGYETLHGRPSNVPSATGACRKMVLGTITPSPV